MTKKIADAMRRERGGSRTAPRRRTLPPPRRTSPRGALRGWGVVNLAVGAREERETWVMLSLGVEAELEEIKKRFTDLSKQLQAGHRQVGGSQGGLCPAPGSCPCKAGGQG